MENEPLMQRRTFLRGLGTLIALPALESLLPSRPLFSAAPKAASITRLAFLYVPNGLHMDDWTPKSTGANFTLPALGEPLRPFQKDLLILSGLSQDKAKPNGDGPGDHARAAAAFLTGAQPFKTSGANIRVGVSADQVAAEKVGQYTRFASLELGCDPGMNSGNCDSGYSCAYSANISWKSESTPMAKEINPRLVFERLFGGGSGSEADRGRAIREAHRKSILDFVIDDAKGLKGKLGAGDQRKLGEYLDGVREIEKRIEKAAAAASRQVKLPAYKKPDGIPREYAEHIRLMYDLLVLAFQTDQTRVATFLIANEGSNRSYPWIGVSDGHHDVSHHGNDKEKQEKIKKINLFHVQQLAYFLGKLKSVREGGASLLDRSMIVFGSGISDGNRHNHNELPILVAGRGSGTLLPGRHVRYPKNTPLNNLFLSLLDRMDSTVERIGDSTGRLGMLQGET